MLPRIWAIVYFATVALFELGQNAVILETVMATLEDLRPAMRPSRMFSLAWIAFIVVGLYMPFLASGASGTHFWFPAALSSQGSDSIGKKDFLNIWLKNLLRYDF